MADRASVHGPIRIINTGDSVWGGQITLTPGTGGGNTVQTFTGLDTRVFRTTAHVIISPGNSAAGVQQSGSSTGLSAAVTANGELTIATWKSGAVTPVISFIVFDGGTALS